MTSPISRRVFSQFAAAWPTASMVNLASLRSPSERVRLGFIGVGNRGCQLLRAFLSQPDAEVVALCDVYEPYLFADYSRVDPRFLNLDKRIPRMPDVPDNVERVRDFRRLLDRNDIDAVVIATPDHWHAIQMIDACRAGKDVYVEKPLSITIAEGRRMVQVARETERVVQVGTHRRSSTHYSKLAELVRGGALGKVTVARIAYATNMVPKGIGHAPDSLPPNDLDWDMWLGPRPLRPFNENIMPYKFRWWHLYSSQMGNWGVHYFDLVRWLTGETAPASVVALGGRYAVQDDRTIPDTVEAIFEHSSGMLTTFSLHEATGQPLLSHGAEIELHGTLGSLYANEKSYQIVPEKGGQFQDPSPRRKPESGSSKDGNLDEQHARDFLNCVKSRKRPAADIEDGHLSTTFAHLANISLATRSRLEWDATTERITNHEVANEMLSYEYRKPWKLA